MYNPIQLFASYVIVGTIVIYIGIITSFYWLIYGACGLFLVGTIHSVIRLRNLLNWEEE